ncbi:MAG TPA: hypothetical protein VF777_13350 [Phycisphaerales bacterium]
MEGSSSDRAMTVAEAKARLLEWGAQAKTSPLRLPGLASFGPAMGMLGAGLIVWRAIAPRSSPKGRSRSGLGKLISAAMIAKAARVLIPLVVKRLW